MVKIICEPSYGRWQTRKKQLYKEGWHAPVSRNELVKGEDRIIGVVVRVEFGIHELYGRVADEVEIEHVVNELESAIKEIGIYKEVIEHRGKHEQARREKGSAETGGSASPPVWCHVP